MAEIRHALTIAVPRGDVYTALTDQQALASWWMPEVRAAPREVCFRHTEWRALTDHVGECTHHWGRLLHKMKRLCEAGAFASAVEATDSGAV